MPLRSLLPLACALCLSACPKGDSPDAGPPPAASPPSTKAEPVQDDASAQVTSRQQTHMSTYVAITVAAPPSGEVNAAIDAAFAEVARLESDLSEWRDTSELSHLNAQAGGAPMKVGEELFEVLSLAKEIGEKSDGALDVTFGSLIGLWDFRMQSQRVPTPEELAKRLPLVNFRRIRLDARARTALLEQKGCRVGLGAIAKGYAVDRASAVLAQKGYPAHLVIAGGDGVARGRKGDRKWRIGIRDPEGQGIWGTLDVEDEGFATSGSYEKFFVQDGKRYHHIMNPRTGMPAEGTSSVTVLAKDATRADGWATALFVLGPKRGLAVAKKEGLQALWFDEAFAITQTDGMAKRVQRLAAEGTADGADGGG